MQRKRNRYVIHGRPFCFVVFVVEYNRMIRNENDDSNKKQTKQKTKQNWKKSSFNNMINK